MLVQKRRRNDVPTATPLPAYGHIHTAVKVSLQAVRVFAIDLVHRLPTVATLDHTAVEQGGMRVSKVVVAVLPAPCDYGLYQVKLFYRDQRLYLLDHTVGVILRSLPHHTWMIDTSVFLNAPLLPITPAINDVLAFEDGLFEQACHGRGVPFSNFSRGHRHFFSSQISRNFDRQLASQGVITQTFTQWRGGGVEFEVRARTIGILPAPRHIAGRQNLLGFGPCFSSVLRIAAHLFPVQLVRVRLDVRIQATKRG